MLIARVFPEVWVKRKAIAYLLVTMSVIKEIFCRQKWFFVGLMVVFGGMSSFGQVIPHSEKYRVTIQVTNLDSSAHVGEPFYITGIFNSWRPNERLVGAIPAYGEQVDVVIEDFPPGLFEYKFNRGDWKTLACGASGRLGAPWSAEIASDTVLQAAIEGWRDDFPESTASPQVRLMAERFHLPRLDVDRRVWVYLPKGYDDTDRSYPVVYMHDGQDLFDEKTSKGRIGPLEWEVDETLDTASLEAIVVAIAHAEDIEQRQNEYFVSANSKFPNAVGREYLEDIVHTLKPYVDSHYRTMSDKGHTAMVGSSVGGLLTFYAGVLYPEVFGSLGVFSPSVWLDEGHIYRLLQTVEQRTSIRNQHYFFYGGDNENRIKNDGSRVDMHADLLSVTALFQEEVHPYITMRIRPGGRHGAWYWRQAFPQFVQWWSEQMFALPPQG